MRMAVVESGCLTPNSRQDGPLFLWKACGTVTDIEKIATCDTKQGVLRVERVVLLKVSGC